MSKIASRCTMLRSRTFGFKGESKRRAWGMMMPLLVVETHLGINGKFGIPRVWRNNFADAVLRSLCADFLHVFFKVAPFLFGRAIGRGVGNAMGARRLSLGFTSGCRLTASFDRGKIESGTSHRAKRRRWIDRVITVGVHLGFWRRRARGAFCDGHGDSDAARAGKDRGISSRWKGLDEKQFY